MRLGLFVSAQHPAGVDPVRALDEHLEQVRTARELGFDSIFAGQHYLSAPFQMLQPVPLLARLAAEAGEMRVGTGVLLLTLLNPVEVAEAAATLDVLTSGRFVLGLGLGYRREENEAFGLPAARARVLAEKLEVVRRLLEGEEMTAAGHGYRLEQAQLSLLPRQRPRPPIWLAANNDAGVRRAARLADTWYLNPHGSVDELERQVALYLDERGSRPDELPLMREACVAPTDEEAFALARPHLEAKYRAYVAWGQDEAVPAGDSLDRDWEQLCRGRFLIGSPETVARQVLELRDRLGVDTLVVRVQWPGSPHADALRSLELLGSEVIPALTREKLA